MIWEAYLLCRKVRSFFLINDYFYTLKLKKSVDNSFLFRIFAFEKTNRMITVEEVKDFLNQFNIKAQIFGIQFRNDRHKNREALLLLDISPLQRELIVKNLQVQDYVEGPVIDVLNKEGEMWVFGKDVKGREVYIKITLGYENGQTICISFHIAEHPLTYPFK